MGCGNFCPPKKRRLYPGGGEINGFKKILRGFGAETHFLWRFGRPPVAALSGAQLL